MPSVVANSLQITAYCLFMIAKDPVALISALFTSRFLDLDSLVAPTDVLEMPQWDRT
jgi:hypothetical protein